MKRFITLLLVLTIMLLAAGFFALSHGQDTAKDDKPTFYRLTPGVYVNPWPRFTVTYPRDWVERPPNVREVFRASAPGPHVPILVVTELPWNQPGTLDMDKLAELLIQTWRIIAKDVTLISKQPVRLRDGTPSHEFKLQMVINDIPCNIVSLVTMKDDQIIGVAVVVKNGKVRDDLKAIVHSLEFKPGKDKPIKVPPDVQEFLHKWCSDFVSHDLAKVMTHYSDKSLNSGMRKENIGLYFRGFIDRITSYEVVVTEFIPAGDQAFLAGFSKGFWGKTMLGGISIIKENGEWKWYGNQRDPDPQD